MSKHVHNMIHLSSLIDTCNLPAPLPDAALASSGTESKRKISLYLRHVLYHSITDAHNSIKPDWHRAHVLWQCNGLDLPNNNYVQCIFLFNNKFFSECMRKVEKTHQCITDVFF